MVSTAAHRASPGRRRPHPDVPRTCQVDWERPVPTDPPRSPAEPHSPALGGCALGQRLPCSRFGSRGSPVQIRPSRLRMYCTGQRLRRYKARAWLPSSRATEHAAGSPPGLFDRRGFQLGSAGSRKRYPLHFHLHNKSNSVVDERPTGWTGSGAQRAVVAVDTRGSQAGISLVDLEGRSVDNAK